MPKKLLSTNKKPNAVKSIFRAANILACIGRGVNSITEIAENCELSKSTVHRFLKTLEETRIVWQNPVTHQYYLGDLITQFISDPKTTHEHVLVCADEEMTRLAKVTEETISLGLMIGIKYIGLHTVPSSHELRVVEDNSRRIRSIYAGATGKMLLAQLNGKDLKIVMENIHFEPVTEDITFNKAELMAQLKRIRRQGYATTCGERIPGAMCLSAPITNYILPVALSILGPETRIKPKMEDFLQNLLFSCTRISANIKKNFEFT